MNLPLSIHLLMDARVAHVLAIVKSVYIQFGLLSSHINNEIIPFAANMDGPRDYHNVK